MKTIALLLTPLRLALAGLIVEALAPQSHADMLTNSEANAEVPFNVVLGDLEFSHTGELPAGYAQFVGFALTRTSGIACTPIVDAASDSNAETVLADFTGCELTGLTGGRALSAMPLAPDELPAQPASSSASFPISSSLWLLAGVVGALALIRGRRLFGARHLRRRNRRNAI